MAKIAFFNVPGYGHVNPTLPVASTLVVRGHDVVYYNAATFADAIRTTGARFVPYPPTDLNPATIGDLAGNLVNITLLLFQESVNLLPFTLNALREEAPDVVVFDSICLWGMQAVQLQPVPHVASIVTLVLEGVHGLIRPRDMLSIVGGALPRLPRLLWLRRRLVKAYGPHIFPRREVFPCVGSANIVFTSADFQPPTPFVDNRFFFVGPSIAPASRQTAAFPYTALAAGRKILVSLGTVNRNAPLLRTIATALAGLRAQVIVATGRDADPAALGPWPDNFLAVPFVPQLQLLEQVDLFISHGGNNSVHEALYHGVPLLVIPQQLEQAANGRLVAQRGAGLVLGDRPPYGQRVADGLIRQAVCALLTDQSYRRAAAEVGHALRATGGYERAADIIEAQIGTGPGGERWRREA